MGNYYLNVRQVQATSLPGILQCQYTEYLLSDFLVIIWSVAFLGYFSATLTKLLGIKHFILLRAGA
jgi:hypothetical protein